MALTLAWMSACDIDGVKITTFGPKSGLVGAESSMAAPAGTAVSAETAIAATRITGLTIRRMTAPHCAESAVCRASYKGNVSASAGCNQRAHPIFLDY